jgi:hypothetical protein
LLRCILYFLSALSSAFCKRSTKKGGTYICVFGAILIVIVVVIPSCGKKEIYLRSFCLTSSPFFSPVPTHFPSPLSVRDTKALVFPCGPEPHDEAGAPQKTPQLLNFA